MRRHGALVGLGLTATLLLSACGADKQVGVASADGAAKGGVKASATAEVKNIDEWIAYARCLRKQGVDVRDPGPDAGVDSPLLVDSKGKSLPESGGPAYAACQDKEPHEEWTPEPPTAKELKQATELAACMRAGGFKDYADPDPETGVMDRQAYLKVSRQPGFKGAMQSCAHKLGMVDEHTGG
ncbi:hypothetical protein [Streptomyces sp. NPDC001380]|uniref:hypothetical protein n=1 Tax=Streptomyces sp. NPDC001380 TaxID=3364566 RepID=UPI0036B52065